MPTAQALAEANRSLQRGGRQAYVLVGVLEVAFLTMFLTRGFHTLEPAVMLNRGAVAWAVAGLIVLALYLMGRDAYKSSRLSLTDTGIEDGQGQVIMRWSDVAKAETTSTVLRVTDHAGKAVTLQLMYAVSRHAVIAAIQDHLPTDVRLNVY
jgi:hypothetical protein